MLGWMMLSAELFGVNPHYVSDAKKLKETDPEAYDHVVDKTGYTHQAVKEIRYTVHKVLASSLLDAVPFPF